MECQKQHLSNTVVFLQNEFNSDGTLRRDAISTEGHFLTGNCHTGTCTADVVDMIYLFNNLCMKWRNIRKALDLFWEREPRRKKHFNVAFKSDMTEVIMQMNSIYKQWFFFHCFYSMKCINQEFYCRGRERSAVKQIHMMFVQSRIKQNSIDSG